MSRWRQAALGREELVGKSMTELVNIGYVTESASLKAIASGSEESILQQLSDGGQVFITGTPFAEGGEDGARRMYGTRHNGND